MRALKRWSLGVAVVSLVACGGGGKAPAPAARQAPAADESSSNDSSGSTSEAARTQEMESRAAEMNRQLEDAKASGATGADAEAAYQKFEQERAALNQTGEGDQEQPADSQPADSGDDYQPPPPR